jgi:hypothetical protein
MQHRGGWYRDGVASLKLAIMWKQTARGSYGFTPVNVAAQAVPFISSRVDTGRRRLVEHEMKIIVHWNRNWIQHIWGLLHLMARTELQRLYSWLKYRTLVRAGHIARMVRHRYVPGIWHVWEDTGTYRAYGTYGKTPVRAGHMARMVRPVRAGHMARMGRHRYVPGI